MHWNNSDQLEIFRQLWSGRSTCHMDHTDKVWDRRAESWEAGLRNDEARKKRSAERVADVTGFLINNGALDENYDVIDIGCGPGRFVAEFARRAKTASGTDLSGKMCEYGLEYCRSQGLSNVSFIPCDFKQADIKEMGWEKAFDLVFSCTTPAMNCSDSVEKVMQMSRRWCLNGNFTDVSDGLAEAVAKNVLNIPYVPRWNGLSSYALFNMLWLWGYSPLVSYYHENSIDSHLPDEATARKICDNLNLTEKEKEESFGRILKYLEEKYEASGKLEYPFNCTYIWVLWDINYKCDRASYNR